MKILVPIKVVEDPEQKIFIENNMVKTKGGVIINPFDEYALETALRLTERGYKGERTGSVTVLSIGNETRIEKTLRNALAMGADEAIIVNVDESNIDAIIVSHILKIFIEIHRYDLVIMGKQSVEGDSAIVPSYLAGLLNWSQANFIYSISINNNGIISVKEEGDYGTIEKSFSAPAVISVDLRIVAPSGVRLENIDSEYPEGPRYASMKGQLKARRAKIHKYSLSDLEVNKDIQILDLNHSVITQERKKIIFNDKESFITEMLKILENLT